MKGAVEFLNALAAGMPSTERLIFCGFPGDPNTADSKAWRPRAWRPGDELPINPQRTNGYITVSSFKRAADRTWRRRTDCFGHGLAVMVDDVGTKVDGDVVAGKPPSAVVETSPGNYQYWYFIEPTTDKVKFDATIKAFIGQKLLGDDPGMNGVNRVGRVPGFINGKAKYGGDYRVTLNYLDSNVRYSLDDIKSLFKLSLAPVRRRRRRAPPDAEDRVALFMIQYRWLKAMGMLKHEKPNAGGWIEIQCPWIEQHTARANTGAAISMPNLENEWYGGFQCHHGHCMERQWTDLCEWINDINFEELEMINASGKLR